MGYRIGIDVGGTNTDAVVLDTDDDVVAKTKQPTTADVTGGIVAALDAVLESVEASDVDHVMLGTTHCTNAVTERRNLNDVAALRIGAPATTGVPPLYEWPNDLLTAVGDNRRIVRGGNEFNGEEIASLDEAEIREFLTSVRGDIDAVAVTSVFSPVRDDHETRAADIARDVLGEEIPVSVSHDIGSIGLLERENATALNAALTSVIRQATTAFRDALDAHDIDADVYFGQNDGTLMSVDYAERYPIFTVACGPANSIRGAAYLADVEDGIIVDVGGTTTDVGVITERFPRESSTPVKIGGVRTNFRMPDLVSIGIGGGSIVDEGDGEIAVGPESVGYELVDRARVFGGDVTTATDVAVARGRADVGSHDPDLDPDVAARAESVIESAIERALERVKTDPNPVPVTIVGGGSILVPDELTGASHVVKPENYDVANAIGAAIAQVSGDVDRIFSLEDHSREDAVQRARDAACNRAVEAGARPDTVAVVDFQEIPIAYLPGNAVRMKAKAAGDLSTEGT